MERQHFTMKGLDAVSTTTDTLLDRKEAAVFCKISERTLDRQPDLPRVKLTARRIMYRQSDLQSWVASKIAPPASISPTPSDAALAALRSTIGELLVLGRISPEQAVQFIESAVGGHSLNEFIAKLAK